MPAPNLFTGQFLHGIGGGQVSIDNAPFSLGAAGDWLDGGAAGLVAAFVDAAAEPPAAPWSPASYHRVTGQKASLSPIPAGALYAGGGHWASFLAAFNPTSPDYDKRGLTSSLNLRLPDGVPLAMSPDGALCYKPLYHSFGPTLVRESDGSEWTLTPNSPESPQLLGGRQAIWVDVGPSADTRVHVAGFPEPPVLLPGRLWRPRAVWCRGRWWISYFSPLAGVVLHPFDSLVGWVIVPPGQDAWQDPVALGGATGTVIRVGWSRTQGEQPGDVWARDVDIEDHTLTEAAARPAVGTPVHQPPAPLAPQAPPPAPIVIIGRPLWFGGFTGRAGADAHGWETSLSPWSFPGNSTLVIPDDVWLTPTGEVLGRYCEGSPSDSSPADIEAAIARTRAQYPGESVLAYVPRQASPAAANNYHCSADLPVLEGYRLRDEPLATFEARWRDCVAAYAPRPVILCAQCYTSNANLTDDLLSIPPVAARIAQSCAHVVGLLVFNFDGRAFGLEPKPPYPGHPEMLAPWQEVYRGIPGPPPEPPAMPLRKPEVTVEQWTLNHLREGQVFQIWDRENPDLQYRTLIFVKRLADGRLSMHAKMSNAAGSGETGLTREVFPS